MVEKEVDKGHILLQSQLLVGNIKDPQILKCKVQKLEAECIINYINIVNNFGSRYGVNIDKANEFTKILNKKNDKIGSFCAIVDIQNMKFGLACDGVGTKLKLLDQYNKLDNLGIDLVAMCVNDLIARGVKPLYFLDYIAVDKLDIDKCNQIVESVRVACNMAGCELIGGETAEMKDIYKKNTWDIAGFAMGIVEDISRDLMPKLEEIDDSCLLYGIASNGIHSNGFTLINKLLDIYDIEDINIEDINIEDINIEDINIEDINIEDINIEDINIEDINIEDILQPTRIYLEILEILKNYDNLIACAHITGGGIADNLNRIIPELLSFKLEKWEIPKIFKWIQKLSRISDEELMQTFNCGIGMILVIKNNSNLQEIVNKYNLIYMGTLCR